jgi:hypothetical protein
VVERTPVLDFICHCWLAFFTFPLERIVPILIYLSRGTTLGEPANCKVNHIHSIKRVISKVLAAKCLAIADCNSKFALYFR